MNQSKVIGGIIFGAAVSSVIVRFIYMPKEDKTKFIMHLKTRTNALLDEAEITVERVKPFINEIEEKGENQWIDKLLIVHKMIHELYSPSNDRLI